jgi:hypothetical protein
MFRRVRSASPPATSRALVLRAPSNANLLMLAGEGPQTLAGIFAPTRGEKERNSKNLLRRLEGQLALRLPALPAD